MFLDQIPYYLSILFLIAFIIPIYLVGKLALKGGVKNGNIKVIIFFVSYLIVISILSFRGVFDAVWLPPKIIVLTTFPLILFLTGYIYNTKWCKEANQKLKLEELVGVHIFRFIGSFFLILALFDQLPMIIGLIAGIGDVVAASTSIFVVRAIKNKKKYAKRLTLIWNTFGMLDILATSITAIVLTKISIDTGSQGVDFLAQFPFCFIPSFAPATIIFLHLLTYRKLLSKKFQ